MRKAIAALLVLSSAFARVASAQPAEATTRRSAEEPTAEEAKRLFHEGVDLLAAESWSEAEARFRRSVALMPRASSLYNWALSLFALERYEECVEVTDRVLVIADAAEQAEYREHAAALRERASSPAALLRQLADSPPGATTPAKVPPHPPTLSAAEPLGAEPIGAEEHAEIERGPVGATPAAMPAAMPAAIPVAIKDERDGVASAWFVVGGGALVLVGALVTGLFANAADNDFAQHCPGARDCDPRLKSLEERTERFALATDILLVIGAATVGTGVTLLLIDDNSEPRPPTARRLSGVALSLQGRLP